MISNVDWSILQSTILRIAKSATQNSTQYQTPSVPANFVPRVKTYYWIGVEVTAGWPKMSASTYLLLMQVDLQIWTCSDRFLPQTLCVDLILNFLLWIGQRNVCKKMAVPGRNKMHDWFTWKYWTPATDPSFLPSSFSRTTPAQSPGANCVGPRNSIRPTFVPLTMTLSPKHNDYLCGV